ncbi:MAG: hypothetical protein LBD41_04545 [Clostridiales Family XIII bacterium]|jgi:hypothetical protein|nr:hypothetical protein [Clostridiales Family XIII bacterium]
MTDKKLEKIVKLLSLKLDNIDFIQLFIRSFYIYTDEFLIAVYFDPTEIGSIRIAKKKRTFKDNERYGEDIFLLINKRFDDIDEVEFSKKIVDILPLCNQKWSMSE